MMQAGAAGPRRSPLRSSLVGASTAFAILCGPDAAAQRDTVVAPGERYRAGPLHEAALGDDYRDVWTTPVRVPFLSLDTVAGGLTPTEVGGGYQTTSLRFRGANGREYAFRSMDKDPTKATPPDIRGSLVGAILQDQISSILPAGDLVAYRLQSAAGLLHLSPRLYVMPNDPRLGEFRTRFAGILGTFEERPDDGKDGAPGFAGADKIQGWEKFSEAMEESSRNRLDTREFLTSRLLDLMLGDWDRHEDQYRWARFDRGETRVYRPVPRDRDYAFVSYDGILVAASRPAVPRAVPFQSKYPNSLTGLLINARLLDPRFLAELERPVWDSVALALQRRLPDHAIEDAVRQLPPEMYARTGAELIRVLRGRRDALPEVATRFYERMAEVPEIHTTDEDERAEVDRRPDGTVEVRIFAPSASTPYFRRRFLPNETDEIRLFMHGGDDHAVVRGRAGRSIPVRIIGGGGDDRLENLSRVGTGGTAFYDHRGKNRFVAGHRGTVDEREYEEPEYRRGALRTPPRDRGSNQSLFAPHVGWKSNVGVVIGGGPTKTKYGFRAQPYLYRTHLRGLYAPAQNRFGLEFVGDFRRPNSTTALGVLARASQMEVVRFHGFGNQTEEHRDRERVNVFHRQLAFEPTLSFGSGSVSYRMGPVARYWDPELNEGSRAEELEPRGSQPFAMAGGHGGIHWNRVDSRSWPRSGIVVDVAGSLFPVNTSGSEPFSQVQAEARTYLSAGGRWGPTLALRTGGERVWGDFPFQEAAFLGGSRSLRGYSTQRFAGDASLYGTAELRLPVTRANLIVKGDLGVLGLVDTGRVYYQGESGGGWHTAAGGGVFFSFLDRANTVTAAYAQGERGMFYLKLGLPF